MAKPKLTIKTGHAGFIRLYEDGKRIMPKNKTFTVKIVEANNA